MVAWAATRDWRSTSPRTWLKLCCKTQNPKVDLAAKRSVTLCQCCPGGMKCFRPPFEQPPTVAGDACAPHWSTTRSSHVNLHHVIDFRASFGANLVTVPSKIWSEFQCSALSPGNRVCTDDKTALFTIIHPLGGVCGVRFP